MTLGSFYFKKWDYLINIKPESFKIKGLQKGFITDLEIYQSILVKTEVTTNCESKYEKIDDFNGKISFNSPFMNESNIIISTTFTEQIESQIITTKKASLISYILIFEPKINTNKEYVFLIDCSTSMIGGPIKRYKEALLSYISQLPKECYLK